METPQHKAMDVLRGGRGGGWARGLEVAGRGGSGWGWSRRL